MSWLESLRVKKTSKNYEEMNAKEVAFFNSLLKFFKNGHVTLEDMSKRIVELDKGTIDLDKYVNLNGLYGKRK